MHQKMLTFCIINGFFNFTIILNYIFVIICISLVPIQKDKHEVEEIFDRFAIGTEEERKLIPE